MSFGPTPCRRHRRPAARPGATPVLLAGLLALTACAGPGADEAAEGAERRGLSLPSLPRPGIPDVFKVRIQQGNVVTQEMVDRLEPGMTRAQVEYVLGEPVLRNTFREERWDYLFSLSLGDRVLSRQVVSVHFEDGRLSRVEGDLEPSETEPAGTDQDAEGPAPDLDGDPGDAATAAAAPPADP